MGSGVLFTPLAAVVIVGRAHVRILHNVYWTRVNCSVVEIYSAIFNFSPHSVREGIFRTIAFNYGYESRMIFLVRDVGYLGNYRRPNCADPKTCVVITKPCIAQSYCLVTEEDAS